ncbi:MAG: prefoldin subunit alpha [Nanoarchaeota archaeon]
MENEQEQQELLYKFSMFERQIREIQQQIEAVERGIVDLGSLNFGLDELVGSKDKEIYAALGKGIFVKAKIVSEELNVDIGSGNFVKKNIPDTKELIEEQIGKLMQVKKELENNLQEMDKEISMMMNEAGEHIHSHEHNHECHCEEGKCNCEDEECDCGDECKCGKK